MSTENILDETMKNEQKMSKSTENFDIEGIKVALEGIEKKYEAEYPSLNPDESTMPQYKDNSSKSYEEISQEAKEALSEYQMSNIGQIQDEYAEKMQELNLKEQKINMESDYDTEDLKAEAQLELEKKKADLISQGIERSSIAQNSKQAVVSQYDSELIRAIEEKQIAISEIELKRSMLQNDMNAALEKFDIAYASKLESKIEELSKKYDEEMIALEKYNAKISELRNARNQEWAKWVKEKTSEIDATKSRKKVEYLVDVIKNLSKEEAQALMRDQEIIDSLGDYYQIVLDFANRRR